jgi:F0F1-type ATP synthase assembly protein I
MTSSRIITTKPKKETNKNSARRVSGSENDSRFAVSLSLAFEMGFMIIIPLIAGTLGGLYIDTKLGTKPICILIGTMLGILISIVSLVRIMKELLNS